MSKNDDDQKRKRRLMKASADAFLAGSNEAIQKDERLVTRYVASKNPKFFNDDIIHRLIAEALPSRVEKIPFEDGTHQFRVSIRRGYLEALKGLDDVADISTKPFDAPRYRFRPERKAPAPGC